MNQMSIKICDHGWFATLPFKTFGQARFFATFFRNEWKDVEIKNKGNGWIIRYRGRRN